MELFETKSCHNKKNNKQTYRETIETCILDMNIFFLYFNSNSNHNIDHKNLEKIAPVLKLSGIVSWEYKKNSWF